MVVCRCRKATKIYCFVHKAPVCAECICLPEHKLCVVRTYSDWVIDGDYDWPPKCSACQVVLQDEDTATTRLGCLHNLHTSCLESHLESFPEHTAPAGYVCPTCFTTIWPPNKYFKESGSPLYSKLRDIISQAPAAKILLGADTGAQPAQLREPPLAFSAGPLSEVSTPALESSGAEVLDTVDVNSAVATNDTDSKLANGDVGNSASSMQGLTSQDVNYSSPVPVPKTMSATINIVSHEPRKSKAATAAALLNAGATTRKNAVRGERSMSGHYVGYDDEDEDGISRKYTRRGPAYRQFFKYLIPFWSTSQPYLPVTRKDGHDGAETEEFVDDRRRRRHRSSTMDVRKLILLFAIMSCMATAALLYYRLSQSSSLETEGDVELEQQ